MISDYAWTVYLPSFGDHDPASTSPEHLFVRKGVPTNCKSGERNFRVRDIADIYVSGSFLPYRRITDRGMSCIPRCLSRVIERTEYYSSRQNSFDLNIAFKVDEEDSNIFKLYYSYRNFHNSLWSNVLTPSCPHSKASISQICVTTKLGPGVAAGTGLDWEHEGKRNDEVPERVCVLLVRGDPRSRWLTVEATRNSDIRSTMLRTSECCEDCAVEAALSQTGKWAFIL